MQPIDQIYAEIVAARERTIWLPARFWAVLRGVE